MHYRWLILPIVALLLSAGVAFAQSNLQVGRVADQAGDCKQAVAFYTRSIEQRETSGEILGVVYFARGTCQTKLRQFPQALEDLTQAVRLAPKLLEAYLLRAGVYAELKQFDKALADIEQITRVAPNSREALLVRARIYIDKGEPQRALPDLNRVIAATPDDPDAYFLRAVILSFNKDSEAALRDVASALRYAPTRPDILLLSATLKMQAKRPDEALQDLDRLLKFNPANAMALSMRGSIHHDKKRNDQALRDFDAALALDGNDYAALHSRALILVERGQFARAAEDFDRSAALPEIAEDDPVFRVHHFVMRLRAGRDGRDALEPHLTAMAKKPWAVQLAKFVLGQISEAELLAAANQADPNQAKENLCEAHYFIGEMALVAGDKPAAIRNFRASLATGISNFVEFGFARAELARLGAK